jgi:ribonucleotide monophosphatase NagD (HAD superfamily)
MRYKLAVFDMDGTIYHEDTLIPGASDFFYLCGI